MNRISLSCFLTIPIHDFRSYIEKNSTTLTACCQNHRLMSILKLFEHQVRKSFLDRDKLDLYPVAQFEENQWLIVKY